MRMKSAFLPILFLLSVSTLGIRQGDLSSVAADEKGNHAASLCGFEDCDSGAFEVLKTGLGTWSRNAGDVRIDHQHANTGRQCLQLAGELSTVTLDLASHVDPSGWLEFRAERWTKRSPFTFRIEKKSANSWKEIYNGDAQVKVGRAFLSEVRVFLGDPEIRQLRLTVTSPEKTGILIDDVRIAPAQPQQIVDVQMIPVTLPALVGSSASALLKVRIETTGNLNPISLIGLRAALQCDTDDIESASAYFGGSQNRFRTTQPFGEVDDRNFDRLKFEGKQVLAEGANYVWVACKVAKSANVDRTIEASCQQLSFSNGHTVDLQSETFTQRLGVALRQAGDDGIHTFRIPGLATTNRGTLIGVYDVRRRSGSDLPGDIDVGMSRSTDGGKSWEPMKVIMDMGSDPQWRYDGIGDPAVLVDQTTGTIWVAGTWSHGNRSWRGSGPGLSPEETGQLMLVRSDDDGMTWSTPINITSQIKRPADCFILQGPGKGITMKDGTLVFPAQFQDPPNETNKAAHRLPHSTIIYSKDHGATWQSGEAAFDDTTESQVVEVEPGILMLNCRYNRKAARVVMTTSDLGQTWQKHETSERALIEPNTCMASLIDVDRESSVHSQGRLLFSNPNSLQGRNHMTIKGATDSGLTWPEQHWLLLDEEPSAGYSCMSMIDKDTVGILYEGSQAHMTFQRIPLVDIFGPRKAPPK